MEVNRVGLPFTLIDLSRHRPQPERLLGLEQALDHLLDVANWLGERYDRHVSLELDPMLGLIGGQEPQLMSTLKRWT
jgi:hypothetical protein